MKKEKIILDIKPKKRLLFFILIIYFIGLTGIVFAENPEIFGHDTEEFNGFNWRGGIGELTYSNIQIHGGHSTSEIKDIIWFNETGAVLKQSAQCFGRLTITLKNETDTVTYESYGGAYLPNENIIYTIGTTQYLNGNLKNTFTQTKNSLKELQDNSGMFIFDSKKIKFCLIFWVTDLTQEKVIFNAYLFNCTDYANPNNWALLEKYLAEDSWRF